MNRFADYEVVQEKDAVVTLSGPELLHYKMCKKIAQLTKVIHHLYCKSEDQEFEAKKMAISYDHQLEEVSF